MDVRKTQVNPCGRILDQHSHFADAFADLADPNVMAGAWD